MTGRGPIPPFERSFFGSTELCARIGGGAIGGKASGLLAIREGVASLARDGVAVGIPRMVVVGTEVFEAFVARNGLEPLASSDAPDDRIAHAFQRAELPAEVAGDLRALVAEVRSPLAVRSSSLLEDALARPFAGVYGTKMIPNNAPDADTRFRKLAEAIKFVWSSTWFHAARAYVRATDATSSEERMAVLIQEVVGGRHGQRFYPTLSGVAKSYNYYPTGDARPEEGVVELALGLGKTIVDGGVCWSISLAHPAARPPYGSAAELVASSQVRFWAVNMGRPAAHDPITETEYLVHATLTDADYDGTLGWVASTYDPASDRIVPGTGRSGPRVIDFAPLLTQRELPLDEIVGRMLDGCTQSLGTPVEVEFAADLDARAPAGRLDFLQVRPMVVSEEHVEITAEEWSDPAIVAASTRALGNGVERALTDIVYVKPQVFEAKATRAVAAELGAYNERLTAERRPYLLIGFGRWGSSEPWLGIPVEWGDIGGAKVIVEATLPEMNVEPSQGAHFFHNLSSLRVSYLTVSHEARPGIDWAWLDSMPAVFESHHVRHVRAARPLLVKVDGRTRRGAVWRRAGSE